MKIGIALRYYRAIGKLTQVQVAEQAGINEKYYGEIERDESSPTLDRLEKISYSLGVSMQQIVGYKPLESVNIEMQGVEISKKDVIKAYCNCCGTEFIAHSISIICPQCGCEYSEENDFIEAY